MGILDAPASLATPASGAALIARLAQGQSNAVLTVLGDSTGVGTTRWVYLVAAWLAGRFPAYTVNFRAWNDTNQNYDALGSGGSSVIQTGTGTANAGGPFILTVYNGSTSGQLASYSTSNARFLLQVPANPDLIIVNYGHNNIGVTTAYRTAHYALTRLVQEMFPLTAIACCAQNARGSADSEMANDLIRQQIVAGLCASEGYGLIDVTRKWLANASYDTAYNNTDHLHPNDATGSPLWATEAKKQFPSSVATAVPLVGPAPRPSRIWVPASQFIASDGSPTLGVSTNVPAWTMDPTTQYGVLTTVDWPGSWDSVDVYVFWTTVGGSTGNASWQLTRSYMSGQRSPTYQQGTAVASPTASGIVADAASNTAFSVRQAKIWSDQHFSGRPTTLKVLRVAADAGDTLAINALLLGVMIERAA